MARIGNEDAMTLSNRIHICAGCKVVGILLAAVEHDDERHGLSIAGSG